MNRSPDIRSEIRKRNLEMRLDFWRPACYIKKRRQKSFLILAAQKGVQSGSTIEDGSMERIRELIAKLLYLCGVRYGISTGIHGGLTRGYGKLDGNGYFQFALYLKDEDEANG